jgi:ribonuclease P protein component
MLPAAHRLKETKEFQNILHRGRRAVGQFFTIRYLFLPPTAKSKFGFIVSTKVSKLATRRNHLKRLLRENIRTQFLTSFSRPISAVIIAKPDIIDKNFWQIQQDLQRVFKQISVLQ